MEVEVIAMGVVKHRRVILSVDHKLCGRQILPVMGGSEVVPGLEVPGKQYNLPASPVGVASINPHQQRSIMIPFNIDIRGKNIE